MSEKWDARLIWVKATSADPEETLHFVESHLGLHWLPRSILWAVMHCLIMVTKGSFTFDYVSN